MPASDSDRIAVLIDADNTSPQHVGGLMQEVATFGVATVKRAYGDWTTPQLGGWKKRLNTHAIQPMQQFAYTTGKNSTDSALIIDAMDLLYSGHVDAFALVSSDSDFTRLATRLRESGMRVLGFGLRKTPQSLVSACDRFVYLELLDAGESDPGPAAGADPATDGVEAPDEEPAPLPDLRRLLTSAVEAASHDDGWASLSSIANHVNRNNPSFDVRAYGERKLSDLARAQSYLEVHQPESGSVRVRLAARRTTARKAPAKKAAKAVAAEPVVEPDPIPEQVVPAEPEAPPAPPVAKVTTRRRSQKTTAAGDQVSG